MWECKSINNKSCNDTNTKGVAQSKPIYASQIALYQAYMGLQDNPTLFMEIDKDTSDLYFELDRADVKANSAKKEARSKRDEERWTKLSDEEIKEKVRFIADLYFNNQLSSPECLFDGDLTVLDKLEMDDVLDQEAWEEFTSTEYLQNATPHDKWYSLKLGFKWNELFAFYSMYGRIRSFLSDWKDLDFFL